MLTEADLASRHLLHDPAPDRAPDMLRTWPHVVRTAADLWTTLPHFPTPPGTMQGGPEMARLTAMAASLHARQEATGWPGHGATDPALSDIADGFTRAADLIRHHGMDLAILPVDPQAADAARADLIATRMRIMHTLYVTVHAVGVATRAHIADVQTVSSGRPVPSRDTRAIPRGWEAVRRLAAFEHLTGDYLGSRYATALTGEHTDTGNPGDLAGRLDRTLVSWDLQAHRILAADPTAADLTLIARAQAVIPGAARAVIDAGRATATIDVPDWPHLCDALEQSQTAWTAAATRWAELVAPGQRIDPELAVTASTLRAALTAITHDGTAWATPQLMADRVNLPQVAQHLQQALSTGVDLAYAARDVADRGIPATAPARAVNDRLHAIAGERGQPWNTQLDVTPMGVGAVHANRPVPIPDLVRDGITNALARVIGTANHAAGAATTLLDEGHGTPRANGPAHRLARGVQDRLPLLPHPPIPGPAPR